MAESSKPKEVKKPNVTIIRGGGKTTVYDNETRKVIVEASEGNTSSGGRSQRGKTSEGETISIDQKGVVSQETSNQPNVAISRPSGSEVKQGGFTYKIDEKGGFTTVSRPTSAQNRLDETIKLNERINRGENVRARDLAYGEESIDLTQNRVQAQAGAVEYQRRQRVATQEQRVERTQSDLEETGTLQPTLTEYKPSFVERIKTYGTIKTSGIKNEVLRNIAVVPFGVASGGSKFFIGGYKLITSPIETTKGIYSLGKEFATNYGFRQQLITNIRNEPGFFTGELIGQYGAGKLTGKVGGGILDKSKDLYVRTGAQEIPISSVATADVVSGATLMPKSRSTSYSFKQFASTKTPEGKFLVTSASPQKITGGVVTIGKKSAKLLEDPGIYVTPKGQTSLYFTRLNKEAIPSEYSFNPISNIRELVGVPTVTEFSVNQVIRYPRSVINRERGFEEIGRYQREILAPKGVAVITKRSELGQGTAIYRGELTTSELEAVIPQGSRFAYEPKKGFIARAKGFDKYFVYQGRSVAYREANVIGEGNLLPSRTSRTRLISSRQLQSESSYLRGRVSTPYKYASSVGFSSSRLSSNLSSNISRSSFKSSVSSNISAVSRISNISKSIGKSLAKYNSSNSGISYGRSFSSGFSGGSSLRYGGSSISPPRTILVSPPSYLRGRLPKKEARQKTRKSSSRRTPREYTRSVTALFQQRNIFKPTKQRQSTGIGVISGLGVRY